MVDYLPKRLLSCPEVTFSNLKKRYSKPVVSLQRCNAEEEISDATKRAVNLAGDIKKIVSSGDRVLLKTNASHPNQKEDGAVVDPDVVLALAEMAFDAGAEEVYVGDASSEMGMSTLDIFNFLKYDKIVKQTGAKLVDLNLAPYVRAQVPGGGNAFDSYVFSEIMTKVDVLISIMKMKTHFEVRMALGLKNLIGLVPFEPVTGYKRWIYMHQGIDYIPDENNIDFKQSLIRNKERWGKINLGLCGVIIDINLICPISLTVIDGFIGMEGNGPWLGDPIKPELIIAGYDPVATDSVTASIMGFDHRYIEQLTLGNVRGIGELDLEKIDLKGLSIDEARCPFKPGVADTVLL